MHGSPLVFSVVMLLVLGDIRDMVTPKTVIAGEEQALIVTIKPPSGGNRGDEARRRIATLEDQLSDAIKSSGWANSMATNGERVFA
jgi:hypothetical protein